MNNHSVVLITGALTGIGRATALAFAQEGSGVVISGRRDDAGQALVTNVDNGPQESPRSREPLPR